MAITSNDKGRFRIEQMSGSELICKRSLPDKVLDHIWSEEVSCYPITLRFKHMKHGYVLECCMYPIVTEWVININSLRLDSTRLISGDNVVDAQKWASKVIIKHRKEVKSSVVTKSTEAHRRLEMSSELRNEFINSKQAHEYGVFDRFFKGVWDSPDSYRPNKDVPVTVGGGGGARGDSVGVAYAGGGGYAGCNGPEERIRTCERKFMYEVDRELHPQNHGKPWTPILDRQLMQKLFADERVISKRDILDENVDIQHHLVIQLSLISDLAEYFGRSMRSIHSRLEHLNIYIYDPGTNLDAIL